MDVKTLAEQGKQEYGKGAYGIAADLFSQAAQAYNAVQDELNAAEMKNNQSVALLKAGKAEAALHATDGTEEIFQKAGDLKRQGIAVSNRAAALEGLKKLSEAMDEYNQPIFLRRRVRVICIPSLGKRLLSSFSNVVISVIPNWMCLTL